jgi:hypothetical protein
VHDDALPALEKEPGGHGTHCDEPGEAAYEPAAHSEHDCDRAASANDPGAH